MVCVFIGIAIFNIKKENQPKLAHLFSKGLKNEFETAMINEPSVFEALKKYCIQTTSCLHLAVYCLLLHVNLTVYFLFLFVLSISTTQMFLRTLT